MIVEDMEYARFLFGVFLMILSGYLWSLVIFKKMSMIERIVFGFGFTLVFSSTIVMLFSLWVHITISFLLIFFIIYIGATIPFLVIKTKKSGFSFSLPEKKEVIKIVILAAILLFVVYMTFLPHSTNKYYLPFHADEWIHWGYTHGFMNSGEIKFPNPFTGGNEAINPESGFHVFLANFKWLSGAELQTIFLFMPSLLAVFTSLAAFCLGERSERKFGLEAAFLIAFVPTSVRFLGPSFLVPLSLGLFLTLLSLLIAQTQGYRKYSLLLLLVFFIAIVHPPSAVAVAIVLLCYAVFLSVEKKYREGAFVAATAIIPFLIAYFIIPKNYFEMGINALFGEEYVSTLPKVLLSLAYLGNIVWALFFFASFMAIYKGKALQRSMFLAALSFISIIFLYDQYTFGLPILYDRAFAYLFLFVALLAGYGLAGIRKYGEEGVKYVITKLEKIFKNKSRKEILTKGIGIGISIILCLIIAFLAIPVHKEEAYYTLTNEKEFDTFDWIRNNIDSYKDEYSSFEKAAVYPSKAPIFSAVTGVYTLSSSLHPKYGEDIRSEVDSFLNGKGKNIDFLEKYDIGVVYGDPENDYLQRVHERVFLYYGIPPVADFTCTPGFPRRTESVTFVSTSTTSYGNITRWAWDFGDGNSSDGRAWLAFGEGEYVNTKMMMNRSFTVEMWLQPDFSYDDGKIHEWFYWREGGTHITCYKHSNGRVYFVVRGEEWKSAYSIIEFEANEWHHFVGSYNGWTGTFNLYWDGKIVEVKGGGGTISSEEGTVIIGGRNERWFNGSIKDVRIYGRVMSDREVIENYQGNITIDGLVAWWKLDEGTGDVAMDSIGGHDAIIHGAKWIYFEEYAYSELGEYKVTLTIWNTDGLSDSASKYLVVSP